MKLAMSNVIASPLAIIVQATLVSASDETEDACGKELCHKTIRFVNEEAPSALHRTSYAGDLQGDLCSLSIPDGPSELNRFYDRLY